MNRHLKHRGWLLLISALVNIFLILLVFFREPSSAPKPHPVPGQLSLSSSAALDPAEATSVSAVFAWEQLSESDLSSYIENLRAVGCPEETIRAIILHEIETRFAARRAEIPVEDHFWADPGQRKKGKLERMALEQELDREQRELVQQLLGISWHRPHRGDRANDLDNFFWFLPPEKALETAILFQELADWEERFQEETDRIVLPSDRARQAAYLQEFKSRLQQVLTPAELEELQLRFWTADLLDVWSVESQIGNTLTAGEVREFVKIKYHGRDPLEWIFFDLDEKKPSLEEQATYDERMRAFLGEARYQGYLRAKDFEFRFDARMAAGAGLPIEKAWDLFDIRTLAQAQAEQVKESSLIPPAQRAQILQEIRLETERALSDLLGFAAAQELLSQNGNWVQSLEKP